MTDTFLEYESSREDSEPIELYSIIVSTGQAYYLTSSIRDFVYEGRVYKATAIDHEEIGVDTTTDPRTFQVKIAIDHPLVKRWTRYVSPPKRTSVTCYRLQRIPNVAELWWGGNVTSLSWDEGIATLHVPARMGAALEHKVPNVCVSVTCKHVLYDASCGISKTGANPFLLSHQRIATVLAVNGRDVKVDLDDSNRIGTQWAFGGTLTHSPTGEVMTITKQSDVSPGTSTLSVLTMQARIEELKVGDSVVIQRGCKNTVLACRDDFDNVDKFSGYSLLPHVNPFKVGEVA